MVVAITRDRGGSVNEERGGHVSPRFVP
jgi:hypothetical protein